MRIAVFTSYLPPHIGGIEVAAESQIKELLSKGHAVIATTSAVDAKPGLTESPRYQLRRIRAWNFFEAKMNAAFPIFSFSLFWHSFKAIKDADVVHAHDAFYLSSFSAAVWARLLRKPLVLTQHVDIVAHPQWVVRKAQRLAYATTGRFIIRSSTKILVLNDRVRDFVMAKKIDASRIVFLPNSVDVNLFSPPTGQEKALLRKKYKLPADKTIALFVGRFVPKKGFSKLINLQPIGGLDFVFVGGDAPNGHSREDHFFLGEVSRKNIADIFKLCDIFVLPSEGEGFPVTIQEAMASGLPIVTSDDPAYHPYAFDHKSIVFIDPSKAGIAGAIKELLPDKSKQKQMGRYSRDYAVKHFGQKTHIKKLLGVYEELLV